VERLSQEIERAVAAALAEDAADADETTRLLVPRSSRGRAEIIARAPGVISGQLCAAAVFERLGGEVRYEPAVPDSGAVAAGERVASLEGPLGMILSGERTAMNFLCHLSGIATLTSRFVARVEGTGVRMLDTRKTTPGLRYLEKMAVFHGGGNNHRADLSSYVLVKENHIAASGGLDEVIGKLGDRIGECEIEVTGIGQLRSLEESPPGRVMLDNFSPGLIRDAVAILSSWERRPEIEVSGGITLDNVADYAVEGVDFISTGSITASAPSLDLSLLAEGA
jgi:nicotinate-nucleotide pyrophosphorylase (carboxylating)